MKQSTSLVDHDVYCPDCGVYVRTEIVGTAYPPAYLNKCAACQTRESRARCAGRYVALPAVAPVRIGRLPVLSEADNADLSIRAWANEWIRRQQAPATRRKRARVTFCHMSMTVDHLVSLWHKQGGRCALSGRPLVLKQSIAVGKGTGAHNARDAHNVSVDRIDSACGYFAGNVQLVCLAVNGMKSNRSQGEFAGWCKAVLDRENEAS